MNPIKPFTIDKQVVWQSYLKVKASRGAPGIDNQSIEAFEENLKDNLYKLWNRLSSGSYFPPPVKRVEIPKASGGVRALGIPTVSDRIAQMVVKHYLEPLLDPVFDRDSYGYRPGKSAKQAVAVTRKRCWQYDWVVEFDIKGAFDHIDHSMLLKALRHHSVPAWTELYIQRWLTAPFEGPNSTRNERNEGVPQGGVISPLLMNLFMHYTIDLWMRRSFSECPFARYADDAVVHCSSREQAEEIYRAIEARLAECALTMHPDKSRVVYCKDSNRRSSHKHQQFTFLGFTFRPRTAFNNRGQRFTSFVPAVSDDALKRMRAEIRSWRLVRQTSINLEELSRKYNKTLRGWWNYYGSFYPSQLNKLAYFLDERLTYWARRKYKRLAGHRKRSHEWIFSMGQHKPHLFVHWEHLGG